MSSRLVIRINNISNNAEWIFIDEHLNTIEGPSSSPLGELAEKSKRCQVIILIPGEAISLQNSQIPTTSYNNLLKAIPYAIEENLAEDLDNLHFALLDNDKNLQTTAVISHTDMTSYMDKLKTAQIEADIIIPDLLCLPTSNNKWYILISKTKALCSFSKNLRFVTELDNLQELLELSINSNAADKPESIEYILSLDSNTNYAKNISLPIKENHIQCHEISYLSQHLYKNNFNLLQGSYKNHKKQFWGKRSWVFAAIATIIWGTTILANDIYLHHKLYKHQQNLQSQVEKIYKEIFPKSHFVTSPKIRLKRELKKLRAINSGGNLLSLLKQISPEISNSPNTSVQSLEFKNNEIQLKLRARQFKNIDVLSKSLTNKGLIVKSINAQGGEKFAVATLVIRRHS